VQLKRLLFAVLLGTLSCLSFNAVPYFPAESIFTFTLAVVVIACFRTDVAIRVTLGIFAISLAYHSVELFVLFMVFVFTIEMGELEFLRTPAAFLLVASAPFLALFNVFGAPVPLEFLTIFLAAFLMDKRRAPVIAGSACLLCCLVAIIGEQTFIGNLVIGKPVYSFYQAKGAYERFYDLSWFFGRLKLGLLVSTVKTLIHLIIFIISHPLILLQLRS